MKRVLFIAVFAVISLASCKKDRTCTCTVTSTAVPAVAVKTTVTDYPKSKKAAAKNACAVSANVLGRRQIWSQVEHIEAVMNGTTVVTPAYDKTTECKLK